MPDTDRLINKDQGDSIIAAIQGITSRLQEMYTVDDALSSTSENPVQNKVVTAALDNKVDKVEGKGLSTNDYTNDDKASVANSAEQLESTQTATGNPITLTDAAPINAESLVVELEPKQDLHGQSAPYVGGAGKNKFGTSLIWSLQNSANNDGVISNTTADNRDAFFFAVYVISGDTVVVTAETKVVSENGRCYQTITIPNGSNPDTIRIYHTGGAADIGLYATFRETGTYTVSLDLLGHNPSVVGGLSFKDIQIEEGSTMTSFAPYSNICPITGYTECEVDDVGKNKLPMTVEGIKAANTEGTWSGNVYTINGVTLTILTNTGGNVTGIVVNGNASTNVFFNIAGGISIYSGQILNGAPTGGRLYISNSTGTEDYAADTGSGSTISADKTDCICYIVILSGTSLSNVVYYPMLRLSTETDPTFEPYRSSNATIQFGQTVMGGKVNVTDGGTDDDRTSVDLGSLTWYSSIENSFSAEITNLSLNQKAICDRYIIIKDYNVWAATDYAIWLSDVQGAIYVRDSSYNDAASFKAAMNGVQFVYEKATTTTIATPPTELKLLKGTNNITTNGTTINLGYQPDNVIGEVKVEIEQHLEMPYLRILDNDVDTEIKNYQLYYRLISSAYTLVNLAEMLQHRFLFVEIIQNPSGTANHTLLHSALIDPRTIDGFEYQMKAGTGDTVIIESNIAENKFDLSVRYTGTHTSGDPTDYYVTIRMVD